MSSRESTTSFASSLSSSSLSSHSASLRAAFNLSLPQEACSEENRQRHAALHRRRRPRREEEGSPHPQPRLLEISSPLPSPASASPFPSPPHLRRPAARRVDEYFGSKPQRQHQQQQPERARVHRVVLPLPPKPTFSFYRPQLPQEQPDYRAAMTTLLGAPFHNEWVQPESGIDIGECCGVAFQVGAGCGLCFGVGCGLCCAVGGGSAADAVFGTDFILREYGRSKKVGWFLRSLFFCVTDNGRIL